MKTKKFSKKLKLKKQTISNLRNGEMNKLIGGADYTLWPQYCNTYEPECSFIFPCPTRPPKFICEVTDIEC